MPERPTPTVPTPTPEKRRIAAENFERAKQVIATGTHDYGIQLLLTCCTLDPANLLYRQHLRRAQKEKFGNNLRGSRFAFLTTPGIKRRVKVAKSKRDYLAVLEQGELVLTKNPWDLGTQMDMAEAFDALGLLDLAVYTLDQARQKYPKNATLNRALARLFEKRGDYQKATVLWNLVKETNPGDMEAAHKAKDLAASETIVRGGYEAGASGSKTHPSLSGSQGHAALNRSGSGVVGTADAADRLARDTAPLLKRLEADPTEPSLYVQLATLYRRHQQDDRARAVLQQGLGPTGNHFSLQLELLELDLLPHRKNLEKIESQLKKLRSKVKADDDTAEEGPTEDELLRARAKLVKEITTREAEILRTKADRFPADLVHRLELGARLLKLERTDEAIAELQQARRDEKLKGRASLLLALGFRSKNNWRLAQRNLEDAVQTLPASDEANRKEALYQLATGSAEHGDLSRAVDVGHELANIDFGFKNIGKLLDEWHAKAEQ